MSIETVYVKKKYEFTVRITLRNKMLRKSGINRSSLWGSDHFVTKKGNNLSRYSSSSVFVDVGCCPHLLVGWGGKDRLFSPSKFWHVSRERGQSNELPNYAVYAQCVVGT